MSEYDREVVVNNITSPALYKFVFVFYRDAEAKVPCEFPRTSDYHPIHHTRQSDVDELIAKYGLPDWKECKRRSKGSWLQQWGIDFKNAMKETMQELGIILCREDGMRVKYVWGDNQNYIAK